MKMAAEILSQHMAIIGKVGSGKTYAAKGLVETLLEDGRRVCIIDPTGVWHGLRSNAAGDGPGFPVAVFGGDHADVPLTENSGEPLARIIAEGNLPAVLDLSDFTMGGKHRFVTDFIHALHRANRAPLHLIIDEADEFAPQSPLPESRRMLHEVDRVVRRGRVRGFRVMLITQRPAAIHKNVLTQANALIAMRLPAPQDRKAVEEWIKGQADAEEGRAVLTSLSRLQRGEGWVWAPEHGVLERMTFPRIRTFDSSRAPEDGEEVAEPARVADVDLSAIHTALADAVKEAAENDPKALKARIRELEAETRKGGASTADIERARQEGYEHGLEQGANQQAAADNERIAGMRRAIEAAAGYLVPFIEAPDGGVPVVEVRRAPAPPVIEHRPARQPAPRVTPASLPSSGGASMSPLPKGEHAILTALGQYPGGCTREQLSILTGYKRSSRDAYVQRLREKGLCVTDGGAVQATQEGVAALGPNFEPLPTGRDLQAYWLDRLPEGERRVLQGLIDAFPQSVTRDFIDQVTGYKRSSRDAYIQRLKSRQLVTIEGRGELRASEVLFDDR